MSWKKHKSVVLTEKTGVDVWSNVYIDAGETNVHGLKNNNKMTKTEI